MSNENQLWLLIQNQFPDYMRHDLTYEKFILFMQYYFKFLQQHSGDQKVGSFELVADAKLNADVDTSIDQFIDYFTNQYLHGFPVVYDKTETNGAIKARKRRQISKVVKNSNDLYVSKSTEDAYRALFRILFDEEIEFFYPKTVILKPSDGKWIQDTTLKVKVTSGNLDSFDLTYGSAFVEEFVNNSQTGASATVENIIATAGPGYTIYELFLTQNTINKPYRSFITQWLSDHPGANEPTSFMSGNVVKVTFGAAEVTAEILECVTTITITSQDTGFEITDPIRVGRFSGLTFIEHSVAKAEIKSVYSDGKIKAINIIDSGFDFISLENNVIVDENDNILATVYISGLTNYPGRYNKIDGFLSDQIKLRGPKPSKIYPNGHTPEDYYQEFSYVIKSGVSITTWKDIIKRILHPIGYAVFGEVFLKPDDDLGRLVLGMFKFNTHDVNDPEINGNGGYLYHLLQLFLNSVVAVNAQTIAQHIFSPIIISQPINFFGPTLDSFDRFKMLYPPYDAGQTPYNANVVASTNNWAAALEITAWDPDTIGNTKIADVEKFIVGKFFDGDGKKYKARICPEPYLKIIITP